MSEHNPFEAAIDVLECIVKEHEQEVGWKDDVQDWKEAIRILESWPRWEKLIAAAGKIAKRQFLIDYIQEEADFHQAHDELDVCQILKILLDFLRSLPDEKKEGKK